ncbi:MAG: immunoglobulin-like domain-containing protein, partial [Sarcina sp.]
TLTYSVKDNWGRETTASRKITVKTNEKPVLQGITDTNIKVGSIFNNLLGITAMDKEDGDLTKNIVVKGDVNTNLPGTYKLTYFVEDNSQNKVSEIRLITVKSNNKPLLNGLYNITIKVNDYFNPLQNITAIDKEDLDLTSQIKIKGFVDNNKLGHYDLIYSVTDSDDNETVATRRITVRSNEKPVIYGISNKVIKARDSFNVLKDIVATDVENGDLTNRITVEGIVDTSKEGIYPLTYSVMDDDGNVTKIQRNITVRSNDIPRFYGMKNITIPIGTSFDSHLGITAIDKEDGDISHRISIKGNVNTNALGNYELIYSIEDLDGNKTVDRRIITVRSNEKPTISALEILTLKVGDSFNPKDGVEVKDFEDGDLINSLNVDGKVNINTPGKYTLTYYVIDSDGNK